MFPTIARLLDAHPHFSAEEQIQLCAQAQRGDDKAREKLVLSSLKYVHKIAYCYAAFAEVEDLAQQGTIGLMRAIDLFDASRGVHFISYAAFWIKERILGYLRNEGAVHVPGYLMEAAARAKRLERERGANLTVDEIQTMLRMTPKTAANVRAVMNTSTVPMDYSPSGAHETIGDSFADSAPDAFQAAAESDEAQGIRRALLGLPERDRDVLQRYFGIGHDRHTLEMIGNRYGFTREWARQRVEKALKWLRKRVKR